MKPINVIVTASGAPGGPSIIQSLRNVKEREIKIIATDVHRDAAGLYLADKYYIVPYGTDPTYPKEMLEIARRENADVILPLSSLELLALSRFKKFEEYGIKVLISTPEKIAVALNKYRTYRFLEGKGFTEVLPKYHLVKSIEELEDAAENLDFPANPFVIKPPQGKGQRGFRIIVEQKISRVTDFLNTKPYDAYMNYHGLIKILGEEESFPPFLAMEFLPGREYTIDVLCKDGVSYVVVPRRRVKTTLGISTVGVTECNEELIEIAKDLTRLFGFDYIVNMQFKYNERGEPKLLEINPRIAGTVCLTIESGINLPYAAIKLALGKPINDLTVKWGTKIIRYWDHVTLQE